MSDTVAEISGVFDAEGRLKGIFPSAANGERPISRPIVTETNELGEEVLSAEDVDVLTRSGIGAGEGGAATNLTATSTTTTVTVLSSTGTDAVLPAATNAAAGVATAAQITKLEGIAAGATANATDADLRDRATHTGAQPIGSVTGLQAALDAKAPVNSPTFTGTVGGITKAMVGLGNVDNTSDASKPISTAVQAALDGKQPTLTAGTNITIVGATINASGGGGGTSITAGTTISASRALAAGDIYKLTPVDTSAGAVALTLDAGTLTEAGQIMYFQRSGANPLTIIAGTGTVRNPLGIDVADTDVIGLICTAPDVGLVIGEDLDAAKKNVANAWSKSQAVTPASLTDGATVNIDATASNSFKVVLGGNRTIANPTGMTDGQPIRIRVVQDATGSRTVTWGSKFKFPGGTAPTLSTAANAVDVLTGVYWSDLDIITCSMGGDFK